MARLNIAMLAQEAQAQEVVEQQSELDVVGQQAEDAIAEATQQQVEIEQTQQAMDETEEVIQEAEEERQVLEQSQAQGGIEPVAMEALQRAVKRFEKRTGVACSVKSMGLEAFASKTTRAQATKVAMEAGVVEYIKKLIKMLMDAVAAVWEKVKAFVEKIIVGAERLADRARKIESAAKAAQGKTAPADAKVTSSGVLAYARKDNEAVEGSDFQKLYVEQTAEAFGTRKLVKQGLDEMIAGKVFEPVLDAAKKADNKEEVLKAILKSYEGAKEGKKENGLVTVAAGPRLLGDFQMTTVILDKAATWEQVDKGYSQLKSQIALAEGAKETVAKEIDPLTPEQAKAVAYQAAGHMDSYKDLRGEQNKIDAEMKKMLAEAKKLEKEKDAPADQLRVATGFVRNYVSAIMSTVVAFRSYDVNLTKAALDYAAASVKLASGKGSESTGTQVATV